MDDSMSRVVEGLAVELADRLRETAGHADVFMDETRGELDDRKVSNALHALDDIFTDGGEYRCERVVDPVVDELVGAGMSFERASDGEYWEPVAEVIRRTARLIRDDSGA